MDRPTRLPGDCPRCENHGHINLDDNDATLPCPLCNLSITHKSFVKLCYTHRLTAAPMEHLHSYRITP